MGFLLLQCGWQQLATSGCVGGMLVVLALEVLASFGRDQLQPVPLCLYVVRVWVDMVMVMVCQLKEWHGIWAGCCSCAYSLHQGHVP
jgi:hypothetical protein